MWTRTALLSLDDGKTWPYRLLLDERDDISYPDGYQDAGGVIHIVHDRGRTGCREILLSSFTVEDIRRVYDHLEGVRRSGQTGPVYLHMGQRSNQKEVL